MTNLFRCLGLVAAIFLFSTTTGRGQLLLNGGFESGLGGDADHWAEFIANPGAGPGTQVFRDSSAPHGGAFHMVLQVDSELAPGEVFITSDLFPILPEQAYDLTFWARVDGTPGPGLVANYSLQYLDSDGSNGGGVKGEVPPTPFYATLSANYQSRTVRFITPPAASGADAAFVRFQFAGGAFSQSDGRIVIDDVEIVAVPENGCAATGLLGGLAFGALSRARRRS